MSGTTYGEQINIHLGDFTTSHTGTSSLLLPSSGYGNPSAITNSKSSHGSSSWTG
uniref:Uncharacterized protein n=1 Tax=Arundo donax TaxID=35708 RepID=A0A0A9G5S4_ARUDO